MKDSFEPGLKPALSLILELIKFVEPKVAEQLKEIESPTFTVSWILTWYSHSLTKFADVQRIFDLCLSQHPIFPVYLSAAVG